MVLDVKESLIRRTKKLNVLHIAPGARWLQLGVKGYFCVWEDDGLISAIFLLRLLSGSSECPPLQSTTAQPTLVIAKIRIFYFMFFCSYLPRLCCMASYQGLPESWKRFHFVIFAPASATFSFRNYIWRLAIWSWLFILESCHCRVSLEHFVVNWVQYGYSQKQY